MLSPVSHSNEPVNTGVILGSSQHRSTAFFRRKTFSTIYMNALTPLYFHWLFIILYTSSIYDKSGKNKYILIHLAKN